MTDHDTDEILDEEREGTGPSGSTIKTIVVAAVIAVLALGILFLLAERNARSYFLVVEGNELLVQRGIFFPVGERRFTPDEPDFAAAYHPVPIPSGDEVEQRRAFDERTDLDRVLVNTLLGWSRERIDPEQPEQLEEGIYYLRRAENLPTTTTSQRDEMDILRGEVAYHEGRRFIESALRNLDTARERLTQARDSPAGWGRESRELLEAISEPEEDLRRALGEVEAEFEPEPEEPAEEDVEVDEELPDPVEDEEMDDAGSVERETIEPSRRIEPARRPSRDAAAKERQDAAEQPAEPAGPTRSTAVDQGGGASDGEPDDDAAAPSLPLRGGVPSDGADQDAD